VARARQRRLQGVQADRRVLDARRAKPGFADHPDGFEIGSYVVDRDAAWIDGFITVH